MNASIQHAVIKHWGIRGYFNFSSRIKVLCNLIVKQLRNPNASYRHPLNNQLQFRNSMKKIVFSIIILIASFMFGFSQADTVFNQTDKNGLKQGHWKKFFPNGKIMYQGTFKNDKPIGKMVRFYESGNKQATMFFREDGITSMTKLYYEDGELSAEGLYRKMQKDSVWNYYSYYTGTLVSKEYYAKGKKDGIQKSYYPNGVLSEEIEFKNDIKEGLWKQYFEDGKIKMTTTHKWNKVNGKYTFYYPTGVIMMIGLFDDNKKHGTWAFYNEDGKEKYQIRYNMGIVNSEDEKLLLQQDEEFFKMIEENIGKFEDPSIEDFFRSPGM